MMNIKAAYQLLDLPLNASKEDKRRAYRKLAKLYHPDKNDNEDAIRKFIEVGEAYELINSSKNIHKTKKTNYPKFRHQSYSENRFKINTDSNINDRTKRARKIFDYEFTIQSDKLYRAIFNKYKTSYQRRIAIVFSIIGLIISAIFVFDTYGATEDYSIFNKASFSRNNIQTKPPLSFIIDDDIIVKYKNAEFIISLEEFRIIEIINNSKHKKELLFIERTIFFKNVKSLKIVNPLNKEVFICKPKNANIEMWIYLILFLMLFPLFTFFVEKPSFNFVFFAINYNLYGFPVSLLLIMGYATPLFGL